MKIMKKIVLLSALAAQAQVLDAAPRSCGQAKPKQQQPSLARPVQKRVRRMVSEVATDTIVKDCCSMIMDEAQKLSNSSLAEEIKEMVHMVEMQEMQKCPCHKPKPQPQVVPQVQVLDQVQQENVQPENAVPVENVAVETTEEIPSRVLLAECCLALLDEAENNADSEMLARIECLMKNIDKL